MQEKQTPTKKSHRREIGQSLVELAVSGMLLALLLSGMLDFGRMYFTYIALEDSAGEAALYLSLYPDCVGPIAGCEDPDNAIWRAKNAVGNPDDNSSLEWTDPPAKLDGVGKDMPPNPGVGDRVTVVITYDYEVITPMMQVLLNLTSGDKTIGLTVEAQQIIVSEG